MRRLLLLVAVLGSFSSAAEPWCTSPAWLAEPVAGLPVPVVADAAYPAEPGELPDPLRPGDRLVAVGDPREALLTITRQPLEQDGVETRIARDGAEQTVTVDRIHLLRHLRALRWSAGGAAALAVHGVAGDAESLDRLPGRVVAHLAAGKGAPWVARAAAAWIALETGGDLPPAGEAAPDPFIARCEALWRKAAEGDPVPDAWAWDVEPEFAALYLPYPSAPGVEAGELALSDREFTDCLRKSLAEAPEVSLPARRRQAWRVVTQGEGADRYLNQVKAAVLDAENHGGWPYRSAIIWEPAARTAVLAELRARRLAGGPDRPLVDLALVGPLVMENQGVELASVLEELRTDSPLLARRAFVLADAATAMHRAGKPAFDRLLAIDRERPFILRPPRRAFYNLVLSRSGLDDLSITLDYDAVHGHPAALRAHPAEVAEALSTWWDVRRRSGEERKRLVSRLNHPAWWVAVDPRCIDAAAATELAAQMRHVQGRELPPFALDTVAACLARGGDFAGALRFQTLAQARNREGADRGFAARLTLYRKQLPYAETDELVLRPLRLDREAWPSGAVKSEGRRDVAANQRFGLWKTFTADGKPELEQAWREDKPLGLVRRLRPDGSVAESGMSADGSKVGRWRTWDEKGVLRGEAWWLGAGPDVRTNWSDAWHGDGTGAECGPWLDGRQEGLWRAWRAGGAPVSAGRYEAGDPSGVWRVWNADGTVIDRPAGNAGAAGLF